MYRRATIACLMALFALNVYRASTQSFTTDEAFSYKLYIGAEPFALFRYYDANLHALHTLLVWFSVRVFGLSEAAFRLPSLAACAMYYTGVCRLCRRAFGEGPLLLMAVLLLTADPLILDHMSVARGYGLALGFFAWAFAEALEAVDAPGRHLFRVAVLLALSVAANFTFLFPAVALGAMLVVRRPRLPGLLSQFAGPALILAFLILILPFSRMETGSFYFGAENFTAAAQTLAEMAIGGRHLNPAWVNAGVFALAGAAVVVAAREWWKPGGNALVLLTAGSLALSMAGVAASHFLAGLPFPWARTGIFLLFLTPLFLMACVARAGGWGRRAGIALAVVIVAVMVSGIKTDRYLEWTSDADIDAIAAMIRAGHRSAEVRVASSPPLHLTLALYREVHRMDWITDISQDPFAPGYDYYVLGDLDRERGRAMGLKEIFVSQRGGTALAVPGAAE
jgi:hypothetical protein